MELFSGKTFLRKKGKELTDVPADDVLKGVPVVALYFSAHWCPPCRFFTPILAEFYEKMKTKGKSFEVIFISSDENDEDMKSYMMECHADWVAVPYNLETLREQLDEKFEIDGIPTLVIMHDNKIVTNSGRWDIQLKPDDCYDSWIKGDAATVEADVDKFLEDSSKDDDEAEGDEAK